MWRVAKNAIPVETNLVKQQVLHEATCDHCQSHSKDDLHASWLRTYLTKIWESDIVLSFRNTEC